MIAALCLSPFLALIHKKMGGEGKNGGKKKERERKGGKKKETFFLSAFWPPCVFARLFLY